MHPSEKKLNTLSHLARGWSSARTFSRLGVTFERRSDGYDALYGGEVVARVPGLPVLRQDVAEQLVAQLVQLARPVIERAHAYFETHTAILDAHEARYDVRSDLNFIEMIGSNTFSFHINPASQSAFSYSSEFRIFLDRVEGMLFLSERSQDGVRRADMVPDGDERRFVKANSYDELFEAIVAHHNDLLQAFIEKRNEPAPILPQM